MEVTSRPIAAKGHVTYPPINLIPDTVNTRNAKSRKKNKQNCQVLCL